MTLLNKIVAWSLGIGLVLVIVGYVAYNAMFSFGEKNELNEAGVLTDVQKAYIEENKEHYPQYLAGEYAEGKRVFNKWCGLCHSPGLRENSGTIALAYRYRDTAIPAALEERTNLPPDYIKTLVRGGFRSMPAFRRTEISNAELEALVDYLTRNNP